MTFTRDMFVQRLKAKPFRPFKIHLLNGRVLHVREPADLFAGLSGTLVFHSRPGDFSMPHLVSVTRIEDLPPPRRRRLRRPAPRPAH